MLRKIFQKSHESSTLSMVSNVCHGQCRGLLKEHQFASAFNNLIDDLLHVLLI